MRLASHLGPLNFEKKKTLSDIIKLRMGKPVRRKSRDAFAWLSFVEIKLVRVLIRRWPINTRVAFNGGVNLIPSRSKYW